MPSLSSDCIVFIFCTYPSWTCTHHISLYLCTMTPVSAPRSWLKKNPQKNTNKSPQKGNIFRLWISKEKTWRRKFSWPASPPSRSHPSPLFVLKKKNIFKKNVLFQNTMPNTMKDKKIIFWIQFSQIPRTGNGLCRSCRQSADCRFSTSDLSQTSFSFSKVRVAKKFSSLQPPSQKSELQSFLSMLRKKMWDVFFHCREN